MKDKILREELANAGILRKKNYSFRHSDFPYEVINLSGEINLEQLKREDGIYLLYTEIITLRENLNALLDYLKVEIIKEPAKIIARKK